MALPPVAALTDTVPATSSEGGVIQIKEERPDEAEIQELAARMVEANKVKMAAQVAIAAAAVATGPRPNGPGILNYVSRTVHRTASASPAPTTPAQTPLEEEGEKLPVDLMSQKGKFSWSTIGDQPLPFLHRGDEEYCAVRIIEMKLLAKYLSYLNPEIYSCTCIRSFFVTEHEAKLLNEINIKHSEGKYGRESFSTKDLIVKKSDADEFYSFLELCYNKLVSPIITPNSRCGFVKINNDSVVPYTMKETEKYVPLFYFEGETETLKKRSTSLGSWDLAYLKFCCKVQGIRSELFANDSCQVISLADIKAYFPLGTLFDEFWPPKPTDTALLVNKHTMRSGSTASWIKVPLGAPSNNIEQGRISSSNVSNGWAPMMTVSPRYQPASITPAQSRNATTPYGLVTSNNNRSGYSSRIQTNNITQFYPPVSHSSHSTIPSLPPTPQSASQVSASQIPPLVRVTTANHSNLKNITYSPATSVPISSSLLASKDLMPPPSVLYSSSSNNNNNTSKTYTSVHPGNGSRFYGAGGEVIDLSSPPHSPQRAQFKMNGNQNPQPAPAHQNSRLAPKQPSLDWTRLVPIPESPARQSNHYPFKMQKALVNGKMVPCINAKPYIYSELLMTVNDLLEYFFPGVSLSKCREVLQNVLQITLYSGNLAQKAVLRENNKCKTLNETLPLIQLKDVMQYMPQLRYVMERQINASGGETAGKRARIS